MMISFVEKFTGREISFVGWFGFGLPMVLLFLPLMALYLWVVSGVDPPAERFRHAAQAAHEQRRSAGKLSRDQSEVVAVFGAVVALWLTQGWHGQNTGIIALGGAVAMFVLGRIDADDLSRISWPTLLTFGGGLTLGTFMVTSGTSDWLVTQLVGVSGWSDLLAIAVVAVLSLGLTTVASNTAAAATLIPLAIPLAGLLGIEPVLLAAVVAIATSVDFALVIGTPPTMLAYSTNLFTVREILKKGAALDVVGIALLVLVVVPLWRFLGVV
jgi:sodium-dependent dicarboxylate transporter 2/3/5